MRRGRSKSIASRSLGWMTPRFRDVTRTPDPECPGRIRLSSSAPTPTHDAAGKYVYDKSDIDKARPRRDVDGVGNPQWIRPEGLELPIDLIDRTPRAVIADRGPAHFPAAEAFQPCFRSCGTRALNRLPDRSIETGA
jgi:hypothetical protein